MQYETKITHSGIQQHFKNIEPEQAIIELAWNGFDAKANNVQITLSRVKELGGLEEIIVFDDGIGIDIDKIQENFGHFNDSAKKNNIEQHGSRGRGRLAFHKLANQATWYTKNINGKQAQININCTNLQKFSCDHISDQEQHTLLAQQKTGTCVDLKGIFQNVSIDNKKLIDTLSVEFGWFLALKKSRKLIVNEQAIKSPEFQLFEHTIKNIDGYDFEIKIFLWSEKPASEKSYVYLIDHDDKILNKQLSCFNNKKDFYISSYVSSKWIDSFTEQDRNEFSLKSNSSPLDTEVWKQVKLELDNFTRGIYHNWLKQFVDEKIEQFEKDGIFPKYEDIQDIEQREWRKENTKQLVRELYLAEPKIFNNLKIQQQKIIVQLLDKISISNENDALISIIENVLNLDKESTQRFAQQISKSKLEHIISTIEILQRRDSVIHKLREIMNHHYKEVLETPDLQGIIENNTWLFGNAYETLGAEEDNFTKITHEFRNKIPDINNSLTKEDLDFDATDAELEGVNKQVDLFLARKVPVLSPTGERYFRCVVVEIKRPSVALNFRHLRQLDDYKRILQQYPEFNSDKVRFELILIGRTISSSDTEIRGRINSLKDKLEHGLVTDDSRFKCYVRNWYTLLDEFELINGYLLNNLKTKRESLGNFAAKELVEDLQQKSK